MALQQRSTVLLWMIEQEHKGTTQKAGSKDQNTVKNHGLHQRRSWILNQAQESVLQLKSITTVMRSRSRG